VVGGVEPARPRGHSRLQTQFPRHGEFTKAGGGKATNRIAQMARRDAKLGRKDANRFLDLAPRLGGRKLGEFLVMNRVRADGA
jgi:hypothetical protein